MFVFAQLHIFKKIKSNPQVYVFCEVNLLTIMADEKVQDTGVELGITEKKNLLSTMNAEKSLSETENSVDQENKESVNSLAISLDGHEGNSIPVIDLKVLEDDNQLETNVPSQEDVIVAASTGSSDEFLKIAYSTEDKTDLADTADSADYDPKDITYEGDIAIYTNPTTGHQFHWNKDTETWVLQENSGSYGFENDTHTYTDKDGITFEWDKEKNAWFPKIDDDFMAHYQMSYGFNNETTNNKPINGEKPKIEKPVEKPKEQLLPGQKRKPSDPKWFEPDQEQITKVYVSNLPLDITDDEFLELMQKCGIIMRDPTTNEMRIKLYKEANSNILKGDGLCTYIRRESVDLALKLIDGSDLRGKKIKVELAKFQMKGDYDPKLKPKSKKRKEKIKLQKQQEKMFDWRPEKMVGERSKNERIVILKNVFESKMFDDDVGLILEFQEDLREECTKCGDVRKVILFDRHPEGVAQVNMSAPEEADEVIKLLNGRWFGKRKLSAEIWDGRTKYRVQETDSQITERIGNWDKFLEDEKEAKEIEKLE